MIDLTHRGPVAVVTLRRPEKRNALNGAMCTELSNVVRRALAGGTRAVVVTGSGTSFSAGADLDAVYSGDFREGLYDMLHTVAEAPVPVVAAVNGPAIGAGTQLAMAADLRVVAPGAVFAIPTAKIGLAVDPWTIRRFAHFAGHATARAVLLTGAQLGAEQAHERGFADRLGGLEDAIEWAGEIAALAPLTLAYSKQVLNSLVEPDGKALTDGDNSDNALLRAFEEVWSSEDFEEGRRARAERRAPRFEGR